MDSRRKLVFGIATGTTLAAGIQGLRAWLYHSESGPVDQMAPAEYGRFYFTLGIGGLFVVISLVLWILLIRSKDEETYTDS